MNKRRKKLNIKKIFTSLIIIVCLNGGYVSYAEHYPGQECVECHISHKNPEDEYKLLTPEVINSGKIPCFSCHSTTSVKGAKNVYQEFTASISSHPVDNDKECLVCHQLNERHNDGYNDESGDRQLRDPDPEDSHVYTGNNINNFCLSCHDNSPVALGNPPRTPVDLSSAYEFTGHGRIDINKACTECHEAHASMSKPFLIKDIINNSLITGNDNSVCFACHTDPKDSYAGKMAYESSEHGMQNKYCVDCHNPHGDNKDLCYLCHTDKYSSHYSTKRNKLCVDCHNPHQKDGLKMTKAEEEKLCFQCHQDLEREFGNLTKGISGSFTHHKVDDEEYKGGKVECFDCHNPHIVTKFNVVSEPGVSGYGLPPQAFPEDAYNYRTDMYDNFCLRCHDGSRFSAKNIEAELNFGSSLETDFTADNENNLHKIHKEKGFGCQNCHDAHASKGTGGIKRGALLHSDIKVNYWERQNKYYQGQASCSRTGSSLGCH